MDKTAFSLAYTYDDGNGMSAPTAVASQADGAWRVSTVQNVALAEYSLATTLTKSPITLNIAYYLDGDNNSPDPDMSPTNIIDVIKETPGVTELSGHKFGIFAPRIDKYTYDVDNLDETPIPSKMIIGVRDYDTHTREYEKVAYSYYVFVKTKADNEKHYFTTTQYTPSSANYIYRFGTFKEILESVGSYTDFVNECYDTLYVMYNAPEYYPDQYDNATQKYYTDFVQLVYLFSCCRCRSNQARAAGIYKITKRRK